MASSITFKGKEPIECLTVLSGSELVTSAEDVIHQAMRPAIEIRFPVTTDVQNLLQIYADPDALSEISINQEVKKVIMVDTEVEVPNTPTENSEENTEGEGEEEGEENTDPAGEDVNESEEPIDPNGTHTEIVQVPQEVITNEIFVHLNYVITCGLSLKNVDGKNIWIMKLAKLSETDVALRQMAGYAAKKVDFLTFEEYQKARIEQSKDDLEEYTATHPLISKCHGGVYQRYNATEAHRNMFVSKMLSHMMKVQAGIPDTMQWNVSGQACEPWTDQEALMFAIDLDNYITPLVHAQQVYEIAIRNCQTKEELDQIVVDYDSVNAPNGVMPD